MNMKRSRKSISWAPGVKLRQVKLFSFLDCPVEVGLKYQEHYQPKTASMLHSNTMESNDCPPGFEVGISLSQSKLQHSPIPRIRWQCPPKLTVRDDWSVAAGEESDEAKGQKLRESRVLEAVYPRFSAIPPSPSVSLDVEQERYDHSLTPCIPLNPIEEDCQEEEKDLTSVSSTVASDVSESNPPGFEQVHVPGKLPNQTADITALATAALTAMKKNNGKGSIIDTDLLFKILNDPKMFQNLMNVQEAQAHPGLASTNSVTAPSLKTVAPYVPSSLSNSDTKRPANGYFHMPGKVGASLNTVPHNLETSRKHRLRQTSPSEPSPQVNYVMLPRLQNQAQIPLSTMPQQKMAPLSSFPVQEAAGIVKDVNYYKNLIRQHGTEQKETQDSVFCNNSNDRNHLMDLKMSVNYNPAELKPKKPKHCMFFKNATGCRKGAHCEYLHDMTFHWQTGLEPQNGKRTGSIMKAHGAKREKLTGFSNGREMV